MAGCSSACGWCGRCTEEWEHPIDREFYPQCDECCCPITVGAVSLAGVGIFCSHKCANRGALKHETALMGRRG